MTGGFPPGPQGLSGLISDPTENIDIDMYRSRGIGDDDGNSSSAGNSKDKGRGSYKCGRVSRWTRLRYYSIFIFEVLTVVFCSLS